MFRLPVARIRDGYYSDAYFNQTKALLEHEGRDPRVLVQVFQRKESLLGGVDEAIAVLRECAGARAADGSWVDAWGELEVRALHEGDAIAPWETVMTIEGPYSRFAHLETVYLGCMARRTLVMRNVHAVVEAAAGKPIMFFPARHDHWLVQTGDGWAAHVAGAIGVSTDAQASWWGGRGVGTVPHGLIAAFGGDTVAAARAVRRPLRGSMNVTVLVDFENDSVQHRARGRPRARPGALGRAARHVGQARRRGRSRAPWARRADGRRARARPPRPRRARRRRLPRACASSSPAASTRPASAPSRQAGVPVDAYGVGSSLLRGANDFTADVVHRRRPAGGEGRAAAQSQPPPRSRWPELEAQDGADPGVRGRGRRGGARR